MAPRIVVAFEGGPGAGKTTLMAGVRQECEARGLRVAVVAEPVEAWSASGLLAAFYAGADPGRATVFAFQTHAVATRVAALRAAAEGAAAQADVVLIERSPHSDRHIFMELRRDDVGEELMATYVSVWTALTAGLALAPTHAVHLRPTLEECQTRVAARARAGEVGKESEGGGITAGYQKALRAAHRRFFAPGGGAPYAEVAEVAGGRASADFRGRPEPGGTASYVASRIGEWYAAAAAGADE